MRQILFTFLKILKFFRKIGLFFSGKKEDGIHDERIVSGKAWEEFCDQIKLAGTVLKSPGTPQDAFSQAEGIHAESVSGSINLQGELSPAGDCELESISGGISLALLSGSEFELKTETTSGHIDCDFDVLISGKIDRHKLNGVVGKGGSRLSISTISGGIRIIKGM